MIKKLDENSVEDILKGLADNNLQISIPSGFSANVMSRIRNDSAAKKIISFDKLFLHYSLAASAVAAACLLLAINLFMSYTPGDAEYAVIDYFNIVNF